MARHQAPMPDARRRDAVAGPAAGSTSSSSPALVGRTWLWFVAGCLLVTLLPILRLAPVRGRRAARWSRASTSATSSSPHPRATPPTCSAAWRCSPTRNDRRDQDPPRHRRERRRHADHQGRREPDRRHRAAAASPTCAASAGCSSTFAGLPLMWLQTGQWLYLAPVPREPRARRGFLVGRDRDDDLDPTTTKPTTAARPRRRPRAAARRASVPAARRRSRRRGPSEPTLGRHGLPPAPPGIFGGCSRTPAGQAPSTSRSSRRLVRAHRQRRVRGDDAEHRQHLGRHQLELHLDVNGARTRGCTGSSTRRAPARPAADSSGNGRTGTYNANGGATYFTKGVVGALPTDTPNRRHAQQRELLHRHHEHHDDERADPDHRDRLVQRRRPPGRQARRLRDAAHRCRDRRSGGTYDRHLYMDGDGKVWFGVYNGGYFTSAARRRTPTASGTWRPPPWVPTGMRLYVDGASVGTRTPTPSGESTTGWFRAGCGNLAGWGGSWTGANSPTTNTDPAQNRPFAGSLDEISVWQSVLTPTQILRLYNAR